MNRLQLQQNRNFPSWWPYRRILLQSSLFAGFSEKDLQQSLQTLDAHVVKKDRHERLWHRGDPLCHVGLLLAGTILVFREDAMGQVYILTRLTTPELFGEGLYFAGKTESSVSIKAIEPTTILWLDFSRLFSDAHELVLAQSTLLKRLLRQLAQKNLLLSEKLDVMSRRSIRAKVAAVLLKFYFEQEATRITLPYNRQQMADYIAVERSALSRQLSEMKKEGLIDYKRQVFQLLDTKRLFETL